MQIYDVGKRLITCITYEEIVDKKVKFYQYWTDQVEQLELVSCFGG